MEKSYPSSRYSLSSTERHVWLDAGRIIAAFLVIVIHFVGTTAGSGYTSLVAHVINAEVRVAVPFFFLLTGYFYPCLVAQGRLWRHLRKLLVMTLFATAFYIVFTLFYHYRGDIAALVSEQFSMGCLKRWAIYNWSPGSDHLWFFYAAIYDLLLLALADHFGLTRLLRWLSVLVLAVLLLSNYSTHYEQTRNFLFFGLPFMMLGRALYEGRLSTVARWFTPYRCLTVALVGILLTAAEVLANSRWFSPADPLRECYFGTVLSVVSLFLFTLQQNNSPTHPLFTHLANAGRQHSANIYILHFAIGSILFSVLPLQGLIGCLFLGLPLTFIVSLLTSLLLVKITSLLKRIAEPA